jgi:hypothetical protein
VRAILIDSVMLMEGRGEEWLELETRVGVRRLLLNDELDRLDAASFGDDDIYACRIDNSETNTW